MRVEKAEVEHYAAYLKDKSRRPSRGSNRGALHQHILTVGGETYSLLASWSGKFVYKAETVSFDWELDGSGNYRNVDLASVVTFKPNDEQARQGAR
ncbi:hypothetical protein [Novosphingobium olei]|uniref:Uncharacterized protein n=1 Tax=Novosphingobium olei TaxID=2728851 RepID=A0A7Y0BTG1_9SPHN|nr:hypothetical protein [Novosphingobium olei]NML96123.1 hypothetical protein [Novosphingobium olei]